MKLKKKLSLYWITLILQLTYLHKCKAHFLSVYKSTALYLCKKIPFELICFVPGLENTDRPVVQKNAQSFENNFVFKYFHLSFTTGFISFFTAAIGNF